MPITSEQREEFADRGLLFLPQIVPEGDIAAMRDKVWDHLARRHSLHRDAPQDWPLFPLYKGPKAAKGLTDGAVFGRLISPALQDAIDDLLDHQPARGFQSVNKPQLLLTFPNDIDHWEIPHNVWHLDFPRVPNWPSAVGVQVFAFLEESLPQGGGTLTIAGSHRLLHNPEKKIRSKYLKAKLQKRSAYIGEVMNKQAEDRNRFLTETGETDGVELQVVELTGKPGDVWLMDMGMMHTLAPNCRDSARMMLTQRFIPEQVMAMAYSGEEEEAA